MSETDTSCKAKACKHKALSRGLCNLHYHRWRKHGDIDLTLKSYESHGMTKTPEFRAWWNMKQRCSNPNHKKYKDYGDRGIDICDRWIKSFLAFYHDMGDRPSPKHSIDRIDNNRGYEPENCRWATYTEQNLNRRRSSRLLKIEISVFR